MKIKTRLNIGDLVEFEDNRIIKTGKIVGYKIEYSVDRNYFSFHYEINTGEPKTNFLVRHDLLKKNMKNKVRRK